MLISLIVLTGVSVAELPKYGKANFVDDPKDLPLIDHSSNSLQSHSESKSDEFFGDDNMAPQFFGLGQKNSPSSRSPPSVRNIYHERTQDPTPPPISNTHPSDKIQSHHPPEPSCLGIKNLKFKFSNSSIDGNVRIVVVGHAEPSEFFSVFSGTSMIVFGTFGGSKILGPSEIIVKIEEKLPQGHTSDDPFNILELQHIDTRCSTPLKRGSVLGSLIIEDINWVTPQNSVSSVSSLQGSLQGLNFGVHDDFQNNWSDDDDDAHHHRHSQVCEPLSIAICVDVSGCIGARCNGGNTSNIVDIKHALKESVIVPFSGTDTNVAIYTYATHATRILDYTNIEHNSGLNSVNSAIDWIHFEMSSPDWFRNWEDIFDVLIRDSFHGSTPDVVLFITAGDPNIHNNSPFIEGEFSDDISAGVSKARTFLHYFPDSRIIPIVIGSLGIDHSHHWDDDDHTSLSDCHIYNTHNDKNSDDDDDDDHHQRHDSEYPDSLCCNGLTSASAIQRISGPVSSRDYFVSSRFDCLSNAFLKSTSFICCNSDRDSCGKCHGDNSLCMGCDEIPNSGKEFDICGICGGDGDSCDIPPCSNEASISVRDETFFKIIHHPNLHPCPIGISGVSDSHHSETHHENDDDDRRDDDDGRRDDDDNREDDDDDREDEQTYHNSHFERTSNIRDETTSSSSSSSSISITSPPPSSSSSSSEWSLFALPGEWSLEPNRNRNNNDDDDDANNEREWNHDDNDCTEDVFEFIYQTNYFHDTAVLLSFNPYVQCSLGDRDNCDNRQSCERENVEYCDMFTVDFPSGRWVKSIDHVKMIVKYSANFTLSELLECGNDVVVFTEKHTTHNDDDDDDEHNDSFEGDYKFTGKLYATLLKADNCTHHHEHSSHHSHDDDDEHSQHHTDDDVHDDDHDRHHTDSNDDDDDHHVHNHHQCERLLYEKIHQFDLIIKDDQVSYHENSQDDHDRYDISVQDIDPFAFKSEWKKNVWLQCGDVIVEFVTHSDKKFKLGDAKVIIGGETGIPFHMIDIDSDCDDHDHHNHHEDDKCTQHWKMRTFGGAGIVDFSGLKPVQFAVKNHKKHTGYVTLVVDVDVVRSNSPIVHEKFGAKLSIYAVGDSHKTGFGPFINTFQPCDTIIGELILTHPENCKEFSIEKVEICYAHGSPLLPYNPLYPSSTGCSTLGTRCEPHVLFDKHSGSLDHDFSFKLITPQMFEFVPRIVSKFPQFLKVHWGATESGGHTHSHSLTHIGGNIVDSEIVGNSESVVIDDLLGVSLRSPLVNPLLELQHANPQNSEHFAYSISNYAYDGLHKSTRDVSDGSQLEENFLPHSDAFVNHRDNNDESDDDNSHNSPGNNVHHSRSDDIIHEFVDVYHVQYIVNVHEEGLSKIFHHSSHGCNNIIWGDDGDDNSQSDQHTRQHHHTWWKWICFPLFLFGVLICIFICVLGRPRHVNRGRIVRSY